MPNKHNGRHLDKITCKCGKSHDYLVNYEYSTDIVHCDCGRIWVITCIEPEQNEVGDDD
jgi:hypothetical protein